MGESLLVFGQLIPVFAFSAYTDWKNRKVYNWLMMPALLLMVVTKLLIQGWAALLVGLTPAILFYLIAIVTDQIGGGDILVVAYMGLGAGPTVIIACILQAMFLGLLLVYWQVLVAGRKATLKQPFVTLMFIAFILTAIEFSLLHSFFPSISFIAVI